MQAIIFFSNLYKKFEIIIANKKLLKEIISKNKIIYIYILLQYGKLRAFNIIAVVIYILGKIKHSVGLEISLK